MSHVLFLIFFSLIVACTKPADSPEVGSPDCSAVTEAPVSDTVNGLVRMQIPASQPAKCVTDYLSPHVVFPPAVSSKNTLVVFLPGTDGVPNDATLLLQRGASRGYHSIGLMYPNPDSVNTICNGSAASSLTCAGEVRSEIVTGEDNSQLVQVDIHNSIEGRLLALLKYLDTHRPTEHWAQFLNGNQILWDKVYLVGHSQGSGHAAYQAKIKLLGRAVLLSGTSDYNLSTSNFPSWMSQSSTTPTSRWYGFIHSADPIANYSGNVNQVTDAWATPFGMSGGLYLVDSGAGSPAYGSSHRLYTNACAAGSDLAKHVCPLANGYQNVWDYLIFP